MALLQQVRLELPAKGTRYSSAEIASLWGLVSGTPGALETANRVMYYHLVPFLALGAFNLRTRTFRPYRRASAREPLPTTTERYTTRKATDPFLAWLRVNAGTYSIAYGYWRRFPKLYVTALMYPAHVRHVIERAWGAKADRLGMQEWYDNCLVLLHNPPVLAQVGIGEAA
jgi:hypothetical protein